LPNIELKLDPKYDGKTQEEVLAAVNEDIEVFSNFMANLPDWRASGALSNAEKALIRTFIVHKLKGRI
jgi:hypothetical protein